MAHPNPRHDDSAVERRRCRLRTLAVLALPLGALAGCDDYYEGPPPATAAQAQAEPAAGEAQGDSYADTDPTALTDFHATLDPHGTWMDDPTYGTVWVPNTAEVG